MSGVAARNVCYRAGPRRLDNIGFVAGPGEFVAVIGTSGAGKSTLLEVLAGLLPAQADGTIADVAITASASARAGLVGYVPQADTLHAELRLSDELRFAAELRCDRDDPVGPDVRVRAVLAALDLTAAADRPLTRLSGGERQRVNLAVELLVTSRVLLLDEATTGLDAAHERAIVHYLRRLSDTGCTVVLTTHSLIYLDEFDTVLVLGRGGRQLFYGPPKDALRAAGTDSYVDLLDQDEPFGEVQPATESPVLPTPATPRPAVVGTLIRRDLRRLWTDHRTLALMLVQAPVLGLLVRALSGSTGLALGAVSPNLAARRTLLTLVLSAVWLGSTNMIREIVRDRPAIRRERVAGVRAGQVLAGKTVVIALLSAVQSLILVLVAVAGSPVSYPAPVVHNTLLGLTLVIWACSAASACLALAISAVARSSDRAVAVLPLLLVPQLVLSGGIVTLADVPALRVVSYAAPARWGLSGVASTVDLRGLETNTEIPVPVTPHDEAVTRHEDADGGWNPDDSAWLTDLLALGVLGAIGLTVTGTSLRRA